MHNNRVYAHHPPSPLLSLADKVVMLELAWPFPLIFTGVLGIRNPLIVGSALGLALIPWAARLAAFGQLTRPAFVSAAMALFAISAPIGLWAAYDPVLSWPMLLTLLSSISLFFAIANTSISPRQTSRGLVIVTALFALYFVSQYGHFNYLEETGRLARLGRATGSLLPDLVFFIPHPNAAAAFMESTFLLSLVLAWQTRGGERSIWSLAVALLAYGLLISGSRGAWTGLVAALAIWTLLLIPSWKLRLVVTGLGIIIGAAGIYAVVRLATAGYPIPGLAPTLESAHSRLILYQNSLYLLGDYPFTGIGLGDVFAMIYSRYQLLISVPFLTYSHNLFLSVGLGLGVLGLAGLALLLIGFYLFVSRVECAGLDRRRSALFRGAWLGATVTFVHGLTDAPQFAGSGWPMPVLLALLGLAVAVGRPAWLQARPEGGGGSPSWYRRRAGLALAAAVLILLISLTVIFRQPLLGTWYANLGAIHQTRADLSPGLSDADREAETRQAVAYFERALTWDPAQAGANRRFGQMALEREMFNVAVDYLERAYRQEPKDQATLKVLGYAYLWSGRPDRAVALLQQRHDRSELVEELNNWSWWWQRQGRPELSALAAGMAHRLAP